MSFDLHFAEFETSGLKLEKRKFALKLKTAAYFQPRSLA